MSTSIPPCSFFWGDVSPHFPLLFLLSILTFAWFIADYRFEVMGLLMHAHHLDQTYGTGPHTISIPRMQPALNAPAAEHIPMPVSDDDFKKLVAVIRCAVPYTGKKKDWRERGMKEGSVGVGIFNAASFPSADYLTIGLASLAFTCAYLTPLLSPPQV